MKREGGGENIYLCFVLFFLAVGLPFRIIIIIIIIVAVPKFKGTDEKL